ncbi:MAG: hypothetical protein GY850_42340, partial [bacterium]|nr:hypothetical protein [bacterium]
LEKHDTKLELFCQQFRELALGYKDEKIVSLLKQYVTIQAAPAGFVTRRSFEG